MHGISYVWNFLGPSVKTFIKGVFREWWNHGSAPWFMQFNIYKDIFAILSFLIFGKHNPKNLKLCILIRRFFCLYYQKWYWHWSKLQKYSISLLYIIKSKYFVINNVNVRVRKFPENSTLDGGVRHEGMDAKNTLKKFPLQKMFNYIYDHS